MAEPQQSSATKFAEAKQAIDSLIAEVSAVDATVLPTVTDLKNELVELVKRLEEGVAGRNFVFLGRNGIGKSFLINLLLALCCVREDTYRLNLNDPELMNEQIKEMTEDLSPEDLRLEHLTEAEESKLLQLDQDPDIMAKQLQNVLESGELSKKFQGAVDGDRLPFLLPSGNSGGDVTTGCLIVVKYAPVMALRVEYHSKEWILQAAKEHMNILKGKVADDDKDDANYIAHRFTAITGITDPNTVDPKTLVKDLPIRQSILEYIDRADVFVGRGHDLLADRLFIKKKIEEVHHRGTSDSASDFDAARFLMKRLTVYVPNTLLENGQELIDVPGTDHDDVLSDFLQQQALDMANVVIVVTDSRNLGAHKETASTLARSTFINRLIEDPTRHHVVVFSYPEKDSNSPVSLEDLQHKLEKGSFEQSHETDVKSREKMEQIVKIKAKSIYSDEDIIDTSVARAMDSVTCATIRPILFAALLHYQATKREDDALSDDQIWTMINWTKGHMLLAVVEKMGFLFLSGLLDTVIEKLETAKKSLESLQTNTSDLPPKFQPQACQAIATQCGNALGSNKKAKNKISLRQVGKSLLEQISTQIEMTDSGEFKRKVHKKITDHFMALKESSVHKMQRAVESGFANAIKPKLSKYEFVHLAPIRNGRSKSLNLFNIVYPDNITFPFDLLYDEVKMLFNEFAEVMTTTAHDIMCTSFFNFPWPGAKDDRWAKQEVQKLSKSILESKSTMLNSFKTAFEPLFQPCSRKAKQKTLDAYQFSRIVLDAKTQVMKKALASIDEIQKPAPSSTTLIEIEDDEEGSTSSGKRKSTSSSGGSSKRRKTSAQSKGKGKASNRDDENIMKAYQEDVKKRLLEIPERLFDQLIQSVQTFIETKILKSFNGKYWGINPKKLSLFLIEDLVVMKTVTDQQVTQVVSRQIDSVKKILEISTSQLKDMQSYIERVSDDQVGLDISNKLLMSLWLAERGLKTDYDRLRKMFFYFPTLTGDLCTAPAESAISTPHQLIGFIKKDAKDLHTLETDLHKRQLRLSFKREPLLLCLAQLLFADKNETLPLKIVLLTQMLYSSKSPFSKNEKKAIVDKTGEVNPEDIHDIEYLLMASEFFERHFSLWVPWESSPVFVTTAPNQRRFVVHLALVEKQGERLYFQCVDVEQAKLPPSSPTIRVNLPVDKEDDDDNAMVLDVPIQHDSKPLPDEASSASSAASSSISQPSIAAQFLQPPEPVPDPQEEEEEPDKNYVDRRARLRQLAKRPPPEQKTDYRRIPQQRKVVVIINENIYISHAEHLSRLKKNDEQCVLFHPCEVNREVEKFVKRRGALHEQVRQAVECWQDWLRSERLFVEFERDRRFAKDYVTSKAENKLWSAYLSALEVAKHVGRGRVLILFSPQDIKLRPALNERVRKDRVSKLSMLWLSDKTTPVELMNEVKRLE